MFILFAKYSRPTFIPCPTSIPEARELELVTIKDNRVNNVNPSVGRDSFAQ